MKINLTRTERDLLIRALHVLEDEGLYDEDDDIEGLLDHLNGMSDDEPWPDIHPRNR